MKKFLSMLLALSVVFTYTFGAAGSVFAATTTSEFNANVNAAESLLIGTNGTVKTTYDNAVKMIAKKTVSNVAIDAEAWKIAAEKAYTDIITLVKDTTDDIKADPSTHGEKSVAELVTYYEGILASNSNALHAAVSTASEMKTYWETTYVDNAARAQFPVTKATEIAKLSTIDLTAYTSEIKEITYTDYAGDLHTGEETSYRAIVEQYVADMKADATAVTIGNTASLSTVEVALNTTLAGKLAISEVQDTEGNGTGVYTLGDLSANGILTKAQEEKATITLEAKKNVALGTVTNNAAALYSDAVNADPALSADEMANVKATIDAYKAALTYQIEIATSGDEVDAAVSDNGCPDLDDAKVADNVYVKNLAAYDALETLAKKYAAETKDGVLVRDAKKIDAQLKLAKAAAYTDNGSLDLSSYETAIKNNCNAAGAVNETLRATKIADVEAARKDSLKDDFFEKEHAAVNAVYDAIVAKLNAAKTADELAAVNTTPDFTGIDGKDAVRGAITDAVTAEKTKIENYYTYKLSLVDAADRTDFEAAYKIIFNITVADDDDDKVLAKFVEWYAEKGARTETEVKALYSVVTAAIDAIKSSDEMDAEKLAVEKAISALPTTVTVADKDAVCKAVAALDSYKATTGRDDIANEATLNLAVLALHDAMVKDLVALVKTLPEKATVADKVTFKNAKAEFDAMNKLNDEGEVLYSVRTYFADYTTSYSTITDVLADIKTAEKQAIFDAIDKLPVNITLDNKAAVEAIRSAYDAYIAEYTVTEVDGRHDASTEFNTGEAAVKIAELKAAEEAIKAAQSNADAIQKLEDELEKLKEEMNQAIKDADEKVEQAIKDAADAKDAADKAAAEAEQAAKDKAAAEEALKAAEAAQKEAEEKAAAAEAALKALETKLAVKDATARFVTTATKATKTSITLQFKNDSGVAVDGYKVYMATSKNGTYKLVGTTTTNTFTKKSLKAGKTYYFKVKAYTVVGEDTVYTQTSGKYAKKTAK